MSVKLLTEHRLEFVNLKGGCTGSSESTLVKMQICRGSIYDILASRSRCVRYAGYTHISKKRNNSDKYHKSSFSCMQCAVSCSSSLNFFFYFMQTHEKETQLGNYVLCAKSDFVSQSHRVLPSLKTTTARGLIVGFFDLKHVREPIPCPFVCCWYY